MPPVIVYAGMSLWKVLLGGGKILCMNILTGILAPFFFFATPAGKPVMVPDMFIWYKYTKNSQKNGKIWINKVSVWY